MRGVESGRSERVAIRRKGGRTVGGSGWGRVRLGECESCGGVSCCGGVRSALYLSQGRATFLSFRAERVRFL